MQNRLGEGDKDYIILFRNLKFSQSFLPGRSAWISRFTSAEVINEEKMRRLPRVEQFRASFEYRVPTPGYPVFQ